MQTHYQYQNQATPDTPETWEYFTDLPAGEVLRRARLAKGVDTQTVERELRIKASYLESLEKSDFENLPGPAYVLSFVRAYSDYLDLDPDRMLTLLKIQFKRQAVVQKTYHKPVPANENQAPGRWTTALSLAVALGIAIGWSLFSGSNTNAAAEIPVVPDALKVESASLIEPAAGVAMPQEPLSSPFAIEATGRAWITVQDKNGHLVYSKMMIEGDRYHIPATEGLTLVTEAGQNIRFVSGAEALDVPLPESGVYKDLSLDAGYLQQFSKTPIVQPSVQDGTQDAAELSGLNDEQQPVKQQ